MKIYRSYSSEETKLFARKIAEKVLRAGPKNSGATVFALTGELGSGKTTFIQGFLRGMGVVRGGASPTFILMRRHAIRGKFKSVYHIDTYRIKNPGEFLKLDFKEILADPKNIILIEWAEKVKKILPKNAIWLRFHHGRGEEDRRVSFKI